MCFGIEEVSVYLPEKRISIWDLNITEEEKNKAFQRNGMEFNYISENKSCSEMAYIAAEDIIRKSDLNPKDIDIIIYISGGEKDYCAWSASAWIQNRLNAERAIAYDLYQGCNSTVMAVMLAINHLKSDESISNVLIVGSDRFSTQVENGYLGGIMMGDAGEAILLKRGRGKFSVLSTSCLTDGRFSEMTYALGGASSQINYSILDNKNHYYQPRDTSKFSILKEACVQNYINVIEKCLLKCNISLEDVKHIIFPNTSRELYYDILERLKYNVEATSLHNISKFGHLGCVDAVNNLISAVNEKKLESGDKVILTSMGVGLSWGALLLQV